MCLGWLSLITVFLLGDTMIDFAKFCCYLIFSFHLIMLCGSSLSPLPYMILLAFHLGCSFFENDICALFSFDIFDIDSMS